VRYCTRLIFLIFLDGVYYANAKRDRGIDRGLTKFPYEADTIYLPPFGRLRCDAKSGIILPSLHRTWFGESFEVETLMHAILGGSIWKAWLSLRSLLETGRIWILRKFFNIDGL